MTSLSAQYLLDHSLEIHTYESFGRSIAELILQSAAKQLEENPGLGAENKIQFSADVSVAAVELKSCASIKVCVPFGGCTSVHIGVE